MPQLVVALFPSRALHSAVRALAEEVVHDYGESAPELFTARARKMSRLTGYPHHDPEMEVYDPLATTIGNLGCEPPACGLGGVLAIVAA